ncbi:MAG: MBL fold metallo-hydrolase [Agarilytica sp.]
MKATKIAETNNTEWIMFGRDAEKPEHVIDTNQYMIKSANRAILLDPGGIELFAPMLTAVLHHVPIEQITDLFASHQDPDIISSLGLWDKAIPNCTLHAPWLWEGFIRHFGMNSITYNSIPDEGGELPLGTANLQLIPAHYLHASGNFHVYDPEAKLLMSGDVGAALESVDAPLYVKDFDEHIPKMEKFHQRWMPSNRAKNDWVRRVRELDIDMMAPQHGRIFKGENVTRFLDWFEALEVGIAIP